MATQNIPAVKADQVLLCKPQYEDVPISLSGSKVPAVNNPAWTGFSANTAAYAFAVDDYVDIWGAEMFHGWKEGTDIEIHMHWANNGAEVADKGVKWQIYFTWGNDSEQFTAEQTASTETTIAAGTGDKTLYYTSFGTFSGTGFNIGSIGLLRVKRIAAVGDAPANDPFGLMVGVHYQKETLGSNNRTSK